MVLKMGSSTSDSSSSSLSDEGAGRMSRLDLAQLLGRRCRAHALLLLISRLYVRPPHLQHWPQRLKEEALRRQDIAQHVRGSTHWSRLHWLQGGPPRLQSQRRRMQRRAATAALGTAMQQMSSSRQHGSSNRRSQWKCHTKSWLTESSLSASP